jgi:hypothetical protein
VDIERFDTLLSKFKRQEPFLPFVVEMNDGRIIRINHPSIGINPPYACYTTPELEMHDFFCDEVRDIRAAYQACLRVAVRDPATP